MKTQRSDQKLVTERVRTRDGRILEVTTTSQRLPYLKGLLRKSADIQIGGKDDGRDGYYPCWVGIKTAYGLVTLTLPRQTQADALAGMLVNKEHHTIIKVLRP